MSLIFFGSDRYSTIVLNSLLHSKHSPIIAVVTDQMLDGTEVEKLAKEHNLKVSYYPDFDHTLITKDTLGLCASFDHLIPAEIIDLFGQNLYNLHPSLLPQYRNVSPVQYALALGDKQTGITLFRISTGIDNGEIIAQVAEPILPTDTTPTLTTRLFSLGADMFLRFLGSDLKGSAQPADTKAGRSDHLGTLIFTHRLTRDSGFIEWNVLHKLLTNDPITPTETKNELLLLRLGSDLKGSAQPADTKAGRSDPSGSQILTDLLRALTPWPGVWSLVPTKKGELRISLISNSGSLIPNILIAGKPKPVTYTDFVKNYH